MMPNVASARLKQSKKEQKNALLNLSFSRAFFCSFDYLKYPYYPAYTMGRYQLVISYDNGRERLRSSFSPFTFISVVNKCVKDCCPELTHEHTNCIKVTRPISLWDIQQGQNRPLQLIGNL